MFTLHAVHLCTANEYSSVKRKQTIPQPCTKLLKEYSGTVSKNKNSNLNMGTRYIDNFKFNNATSENTSFARNI